MQSRHLNEAVPEATELRSVDLRDYGRAIRRRWVTLVVCAVLGVGAAAAYAKASDSGYVSTASVVLPQGGQTTAGTPTPSVLAADLVTAESVASSRSVAQLAAPAILHLGAHPSAAAQRTYAAHLTKFLDSYSNNLTVTVPTGSDALQISWKAGSPKAAQAGANAFASAYLRYENDQLNSARSALQFRLNGNKNPTNIVSQIVKIEQQLRDPRTPAGSRPRLSTRLSLLKVEESQLLTQLDDIPLTVGYQLPASTPRRSGLSHVALGALGVLLGLLIGVVIAVIRDLRDHTVRNPAQLEKELDAPVLALVPGPSLSGGRWGSQRRASTAGPDRAGRRTQHPGRTATVNLATAPDGPAAESIRALRSTLVALGLGHSHKVLLVVCADPVDSSSRIAAELGIAVAESGRRVLLVGADLRHSTLARIFEVSAQSGLSDVLVSGSRVNQCVSSVHHCDGAPIPEAVSKNLRVLPNGPAVARPLSLLDSDAMVELLAETRVGYDCVLLDCPSEELLDSLPPLARVVDSVLVVAGLERTDIDLLRGIRQRVAQVRSRLIGAVLQLSGDQASGTARGRRLPGREAIVDLPDGRPFESVRAAGQGDGQAQHLGDAAVTMDPGLRSGI
jgi:succinoglycan biosynthesis transport protein ExoP